MIAAGGPGDREVRYVIKIAADPGNAAVVARETAQLRAFEQRVAQVGASAGRTFANRFGGGNGGGTTAAAEVAHRSRHGAAVGTAAYGFQQMSMMGRERFAGAQQEAAGRAAWAAGLANMVKESERETVAQAARAGAATGKAWRSGFFGELAHIAGQRSTIEMFTGQNVLGRGLAATILAGGRALGGAGTALGGIAAMGALSLGATKALVDPAGTSEAVGGWGVWGADKYASLMNWFGRFSPEGRAAEERGEYIADYFGNRKTAFLAQKNRPQERFWVNRNKWELQRGALQRADDSARFDLDFERANLTGNFQGLDTGLAATRKRFSNIGRLEGFGDASERGNVLQNYLQSLHQESQAIQGNTRLREMLSQKMGDEATRLDQLKSRAMSYQEQFLAAQPGEREKMERAAAGDFEGFSSREMIRYGGLALTDDAQSARQRRVGQLYTAEGGMLPAVFQRLMEERNSQGGAFFKELQATGLKFQTDDWKIAAKDAAKLIGEAFESSMLEVIDALKEATIQAAKQNAVNKGQAMLRRNEQVGLA